jgi:sensor domain CHASE-containing protein
MSTGNVVYLLMTIFVFVAFAGTLAYYSQQQTRLGPEMLPANDEAQPDRHTASAEPVHATAAVG